MISRRRVVAAALGGVTALAAGRGTWASPTSASPSLARVDEPAIATSAAVRLRPPEPTRTWIVESIGTTVRGRPIPLWHSPSPGRERAKIVVVAGIHGNERAAEPFAERIASSAVPDDVSLWIVPCANPDGWHAGTRRNAQGVDLNRNFPYRWSAREGGPAPASALETRALMQLLSDTRPDLAVWVHQPLAYVAALGATPPRYADAWRAEVGDRRRDGVDQSGGGETWTARVLGVPSILVEIAGWAVDGGRLDAHARGFLACVDAVRTR